MKLCEGADDLRLVLQQDTALDLGSLQFVERMKRPVGDALVGEWPQALTGLQVGRIGRQEEQMDAFGYHELLAAMPASLIEHQQHPLGGACADSLGEVRQGTHEHICSHCWQEQPFRLPRSWMHKTVDVEPLEAMLHSHLWA